MYKLNKTGVKMTNFVKLNKAHTGRILLITWFFIVKSLNIGKKGASLLLMVLKSGDPAKSSTYRRSHRILNM